MSDGGIIYSSGREPYYNLNSTWYDPAGSWLDNRRKPFRYVVNTSCVACCDRGEDVPRRGGHNYRCYCYRRSTCQSGGNPRVRTCVHNPSGGPRDYWGRPIGDACNGRTGGHYSNEESVCCGGGNACGQPTGSSCGGGGGACAQPAIRSSRSLQGSVCCSTSGGCGSGGGACSAPAAYGSCGGVGSESGCGGCERGPRSVGLRLWGEPGCANRGIRGGGGACSTSYGGCGGGGGSGSESGCGGCERGPRSVGLRLWGEPGCANRGVRGGGGACSTSYGGCGAGGGSGSESGCGGCERGPRSIGLRLWGEPGCANRGVSGGGACSAPTASGGGC